MIDESTALKTNPGSSTSTVSSRNKTTPSHMSSLHLRPQISVKLPAISMKRVQKNPDQLTIEDLPTIRSQVMCRCMAMILAVKVHLEEMFPISHKVQMAYSRFYRQRGRQLVHSSSFADVSNIPKHLQLQFLLILTAYNVKPHNIPPKLRLHLAQKQPWQQDQHILL